MRRAQLLVGLELGHRSFTAAVGEFVAPNRMIVKAVESIRAQGITPEGVSDAIECADAVARLMRQLEKTLSLRLPIAFAGIHGSHLKGINAQASIPLQDPAVAIGQQDVDRVIQTCRVLSLDYDRKVLHAFQKGFSVDAQSGIKNPVGLYGRKLSVDLHLVTALNLSLQNMTRMLNRAGLEVEGIALPGVAAGEVVLADLDRDLGVTLMRVGEYQTEALIFSEGSVRESFLIPWGVQRLSEGLGRSLRIPRTVAVQLMEKLRSLEERPQWAQRKLEVKSGAKSYTFTHTQVTRLLSDKLEGFLKQAQRRLDSSPFFRESAAGIVMVGPIVHLDGFIEMVEEAMNMPVRLGTPRNLELESDVKLTRPDIIALGLLHCAARRYFPTHRTMPSAPWGRWVERGKRVLEEYF